MAVGRILGLASPVFLVFLLFLTIVVGENRNHESSTNALNLPERVTHLEEALANLTKLVTGQLKTSGKTDCPKGFITIGHLTACYKFVTSTSSWFDAVKLCAQEGASLLEIDSEQEDEYIKIYLLSNKAILGDFFHTGGNDLDTEGVYKWFPSGSMINSIKWGPGEPSKGKTEHCLRLTYVSTFKRFYWYDYDCDATYGRICRLSI